MRNRIVTIVLAICLIATIFCALPVKAELNYAGSSVKATDSYNVAVDKFFKDASPSMGIYFNIELFYNGIRDDVYVDVLLENAAGQVYDSELNVLTRDPATYDPLNYPDGLGWYNSSQIATHRYLTTNVPVSGSAQAYYVVVYQNYDGVTKTIEIARTPVLIMTESFTLDPTPSISNPYYPGEDVSIDLITPYMTYVFYVQIINETGYAEENWTGQSATQGSWGHVWTVRLNMPDGKYTINVRNASNHAPWYSKVLWVNKYTLQVWSDRTHYMPGETASISYRTVETETGIPYSGASITFVSTWLTKIVWNNIANYTWLNGTLSGSSGTQDFVVPADVNTTDNVYIWYWANETVRSAEASMTLIVSGLTGSLTIPSAFANPGGTVQVQAWAGVGSLNPTDYDNLAGAAVEVTVKYNGTAIAAYGTANLTTDRVGGANHTFALSTAAVLGTYVVTAKISKAGYSLTLLNTFTVTIGASNLYVTLDKDAYVSGETASVSFRAIWNNEEVNVTTVSYTVSVAGDFIATGNSTGEDISVVIPQDALGTLSVSATTNINGHFRTGGDTAIVYAARIALTTATNKYTPGDTITWQWQIVTSLATGMLRYEVTDSYGVKVASGDLVFALAGEFEFVVPTKNVPSSYTAKVILQTDTGVYLASPDSQIQLLHDYVLSIWIGRSGYTSGEFKPGSMIQIHFAITPRSGVDLPVYRLVVHADYSDTTKTILTESPTGVIEYTISGDAPTGELWFMVYVYDGLSTSGSSLDYQYSEILVNSRLSGWDKSVAGMSASDFTIMVLIIIMIVLLIVMPFVKARMGAPKPAKVEQVEPPTPP